MSTSGLITNNDDLDDLTDDVEQITINDFAEPRVLPHQEAHFNKLVKGLEQNRVMCDCSAPGGGKTHMGCGIAHHFKLPMLIIGPVSARDTWITAINEKYGLPKVSVGKFDCFINYESLRANGKRQPNHPLLSKEGDDYYPTDTLRKLLEKGVIIIFDECHNMKNNSATFKAGRALSNEALKYKNSMVLLLSGTIIDGEKQVQQYLKLMNILKHEELYTNYFGRIIFTGYNDLHDYLIYHNYQNDDFLRWDIDNEFQPKPTVAKYYLQQSFNLFIKPHVMSIMPKHTNPKATYDIKNGFYKMTPKEMEEYDKAISNFGRGVNYNNDGVNMGKGDVLMIGGLIKAVQMAKVNTMIRVAKEDLERTFTSINGVNNCKYKIVIFADYHEVIDRLCEGLAEFKPLKYTGKEKPEQRILNKRKFNRYDHEHRVIILNTKAGSNALEIDDHRGEYQRICYYMPSYFINNLHQATLRTYRTFTVGHVKSRFFYGLTKNGKTEVSILDSLAKRGKIMGEVLKEQDIKFPGQYEDEFEV